MPVPDVAGAWRVFDAATKGGDTSGSASPFDYEMRPLRERTYWISQSRSIPLPEPAYERTVSIWKRLLALWSRAEK